MMSLLIKTMRETMGHFLQKFEKILKLNTFNSILISRFEILNIG